MIMLQLGHKILQLVIYIFSILKKHYLFISLNQTWSIILRILLLLKIFFIIYLYISINYYSSTIIKQFNLDYIPQAPPAPQAPAYIKETKKALKVTKNIPYYKDIFITLSKLHNIYVILTNITHSKNKLSLQLSAKNQTGLHHYIDSLQIYLPKHMIVKKINFNNLNVKGGGKKKKKKRKKRLNAFQKFLLKKGRTGGLINPKGKKKGSKDVKYDFSCSVDIEIKK